MNCSVVVPVYNSAHSLAELDRRLARFFSRRGGEWEVIYVDDGSRDGSWHTLKELQAARPETVRILRLAGNHGQHLATLCGLRQARHEFLVTLDDDLETPPEEMGQLLEALENQGLDVAYGYTYSPPHSRLRNAASIVFKQCVRLLTGSRGVASSFRALRACVLPELERSLQSFVVLDAALLRATRAIGYVAVRFEERPDAVSGYTYATLLRLAFRIMLHYLVFPSGLRTAAWFGGLLLAVLGFCAGLVLSWGGVLLPMLYGALLVGSVVLLYHSLKNRVAFGRPWPGVRIAESA